MIITLDRSSSSSFPGRPRLTTCLGLVAVVMSSVTVVVEGVGMPSPQVYASYFQPKMTKEQERAKKDSKQEGALVVVRKEPHQEDPVVSRESSSSSSSNLNQQEPCSSSSTTPASTNTSSYPVQSGASNNKEMADYLSQLEQRLTRIEDSQRHERHRDLLRRRNVRRLFVLESIRLLVVSAIPMICCSVLIGTSMVGLFHLIVWLVEVSEPLCALVRKELRLRRLQFARWLVKGSS